MILEKRRRHVARYREIGSILAKYGWAQLIGRLGLAQLLRTKPSGEDGGPAGLREALEELGPTFVKFGQLLSTRPDLAPEPYIDELRKLQDTAAVVPTSTIIETIEEEFGRPIDQIYHTFDPTPLAAASLGQAHSATLHTGEKVIVKIQRPDIVATIDTDTEIMRELAAFLERRWETARLFGVSDIVDEFATIIHEELDYTHEARNTDRLRESLARNPDVTAPKVIWELTTTRVLTIERIRGEKVTDTDAIIADGTDLKCIANRLVSSFMQQIFIDGFFHADPHPGNILVTSDGVIALVDCGQAARLDHTTKSGLLRLLIAFEQQNARDFTDELLAIGLSSGVVNVRAFSHDIAKLLRRYYDLPVRDLNVGELLSKVLAVTTRHRIKLPAQFYILAKVLALLESVSRKLDPDFNFTETIRPYISRAVRTELSFQGLLTEMFQAISDARRFAFALPERANELIRRLVEGTFRLESRVQGLEDLTTKIDKLANRLSFALICAGMIVASSIIVASGREQAGLFGLPTLGVIGYLLAGIFGVWLLISIIRGGRL